MKLFSARPRRVASHDIPTENIRITPAAGKSLDVSTESIVIGRDLDCDLRVDDARVSRRHAEIYSVGNIFWLRDLESEDGTYLNGEVVEVAPIEVPSEVRLGALGPVLRVHSPGSGS